MSTSPNYYPTPEEAAICRLVRAYREHHGLSTETLAEAIGVTLPTYLRMEEGERPASLTQLHEICRVLSISLEDLADDAYRLASQRRLTNRSIRRSDCRLDERSCITR
jgi:transcriptional regulator with XRE-family HTH domain